MSEIDTRKISEHYEISYIIFKDSKDKEHLIAKKTIELWKKTFRLKSIDDEYIPNIPQKLKDFLGKDKIFIGKSTLFTLVAKQYHNAIPQVKQILESPDEIMITNDKSQSLHYEDYILAKFINDKAYFLNIRVFESGDCLVNISKQQSNNAKMSQDKQKLNTNEISM